MSAATRASAATQAARGRVSGLREADQLRTVEDYFANLPWEPPARVVLAQWEVTRFFEQFVR